MEDSWEELPNEGGPSDVVHYFTEPPIAHLVLNRPSKLNAIVLRMPPLLARLVARANRDESIKVIVLSGAGKGFCAGYDLERYAQSKGSNAGFQSDMPWDPMKDYHSMNVSTSSFMALWRSMKPVICKIHGAAIGGGSDIALCCDLIVCTKDAKIGYPPARLWGVPTTAMWVFRVGAERAKRMMFAAEVVNGEEAKSMGLVTDCVDTRQQLDEYVLSLAQKISLSPSNQLAMHKLVINSTLDASGLAAAQTMATVFDGIARHTPEGVQFKRRCEEVGWKQAVMERDNRSSPSSKL